jgi:hypothetical protein
MRLAFVLAMAMVAGWSGPAAAATAGGKKVECWTDKDGHRMCGDRVPPEYAGQKRDVMQDGRVIDTKKAARTPEEIAEEKRQKLAAEAAQRQAAYDRDLVQTYRSAKDLESMRDERLALIDSRINSALKNTEDTDRTLASLRARAEKQANDKKPVDDRLAKQIKQFETSQEQNLHALARARSDRAAIETKFNADIARYNELRGIPAPKAVASPPAASHVPATPAPAASTPSATPAPAATAPPATADKKN